MKNGNFKKAIKGHHESLKELTIALGFMGKYGVKPHDALHVACMVSNNIPIMITEDTGFKAIKEIKMLTISQFLTRT